jgi:hypothetical protein
LFGFTPNLEEKAALVAEGERLIRSGKISLGEAISAVIRPIDPLDLSW